MDLSNEPAEKAIEIKADEVLRSHDELLAVSQDLFGVSADVLAGALYGAPADLSVSDAKKRLNDFNKKVVE